MWNNSSTRPEVDEPEPEVWQIPLAVLAWALAVSSHCLNLLVVYTICRSRELRTPTNAFMVSLACGEVLFSTFSLPLTAGALAANAWPYSGATCKGSALLQTVGRTSSSYSLVFVCIDRYVAVKRPLKYSHTITLRFSIVAVLVVWCFSVALSSSLILVWDGYDYADRYFLCMVTLTSIPGWLGKETLSIFLPVALNLTCLLGVLRELRSHHRIFAIFPVPDNPNVAQTGSGLVSAILPLSRTMGRFNRNTRRALRLFFVMAVNHTALCLPPAILVSVQGRPSFRGGYCLAVVSLWLSYLHCVVSPVVIIAFNRKFRSRIRLMCRIRRLNKVHPAPEVFTISSGLQSILDTTLIKNLGQGRKVTRASSFRLARASRSLW